MKSFSTKTTRTMARTKNKRNGKTLFVRLLTGATVVTVCLLWASAYSPHINPDGLSFLPLLGLMFPIFLSGTVGLLFLWLVTDKRRALLPLVGLLACCSDIRTYCPLNFPDPHPKGAIKVMTYNTMTFGKLKTDDKGQYEVIEYLLHSGADIICIQEGYEFREHKDNERIKAHIRTVYPYLQMDLIPDADNFQGIFSKYPIVASERINYPHDVNGTMVYRLLLAPKDTLTVINNHFQTNHLTFSDRGQYKQMIKSPVESDIKDISRSLASKIGHNGSRRAEQVDSVTAYIDRHRRESMLVMGDFNDTPISYARRSFARRLTDAYVSTANGPGFSFNRDGIFVRIDHMFCSKDWRPYGCRIDRSFRTSDHYPVCCWFARK